MRSQSMQLLSGQTKFAPQRPGAWGLFIFPKKSGSMNERINTLEEDDPNRIAEFVTGVFYGNLNAKYYTVQNVEFMAGPGGSPIGTDDSQPFPDGPLGGIIKVPEVGGFTGLGSTSTVPQSGSGGIFQEPIGYYSVTIFENGEWANTVSRNLKIPRTSIVNTTLVPTSGPTFIPNFNLNPSGIGPQVLTGTTSYPSASTGFDCSLFDGLYQSFVPSAFTGGTSPTAQAILAALDMSGDGNFFNGFAATQPQAAGSVSAISVPGTPSASMSESFLFAQLPPAVELRIVLTGTPTNATVLFDLEGR